MQFNRLLSAAIDAKQNAHAPYSDFRVGAAVLAESGRVYAGCNVENISFGLTLCAERVAIACAVANGEKRFTEIVILTSGSEPASPCGACRQVLAEFCEDLRITSCTTKGKRLEMSLRVLLPRAKAGILDCST